MHELLVHFVTSKDSDLQFSSLQSLSLVRLFVTPWTDSSTPGLPVHHQFLEFIQTHVHWVGGAIQPSHPLSSPSPPAFNLSQHQGLFKWVSSLHQVAKVLEFQLQHQSFQWIFRTNFLEHLKRMWPRTDKSWFIESEIIKSLKFGTIPKAHLNPLWATRGTHETFRKWWCQKEKEGQF